MRRGSAFGWSCLRGGKRVRKDDPRLTLGGDLDELNCIIGVALAQLAGRTQVRRILEAEQKGVLAAGCVCACAGPAPKAEIANLERLASKAKRSRRLLEAGLKRPCGFVLPGGRPAAAWLHLARAVCRRAERDAVALARRRLAPKGAADYLNALSSCLFAAACRVNRG
jgi:cob(I)alamin adenosyltransferase